jgi:hypothetical protein
MNVMVLHWVASCDPNRTSSNNTSRTLETPKPENSFSPKYLPTMPGSHLHTPTIALTPTQSKIKIPPPGPDSDGRPWENVQTVQTRIFAEDTSCATSVWDPEAIKVKTTHLREESPIQMNNLST